MIELLSRRLIPNRDDTSSPAVRRAYGTLCSVVGIVLNVILFGLKYFAGVVSGAISITADAFNNLSDAGSSLITLVGFALAGKKPDPGHPFGHGRIEYIAGLAVSAVIIFMGVELGRDSISKIFHPAPVQTGLLPVLILLASICVKLYMALYNRAVSRRISSAAMAATAMDSLSDSVATGVVLLCMLFTHFTGVNIDAYAGVLVAAFIIYAGINAARDTLSPLLGQAPEHEFVKKIEEIVTAHPEICGMHDLIVHDYGPGRVMISLHAEVDGSGDIYELHDVIDNIERELQQKLGCSATVHMDPIDTNSEELVHLREAVAGIAREVLPEMTVHDLRMVPGPTHKNVIFDAVVPFGAAKSDDVLVAELRALVEARLPGCYAVINLDKAYT